MYKDVAEISIKTSMILMSDPSDKIKEYAEDIMKALNEINESMGLNVEHQKLMELTGMMDEHPEGWDGECCCQSCVSYEG